MFTWMCFLSSLDWTNFFFLVNGVVAKCAFLVGTGDCGETVCHELYVFASIIVLISAWLMSLVSEPSVQFLWKFAYGTSLGP